MKVVIDTNVLISAFGKTSPYRKIFDAFLRYKFVLLLSNEILLEYLEVINRKSNMVVAENIIMLLLTSENIELHEIFFHWNLIENDKEDNKFCDLAIAGNADYLITNDGHFRVVNLSPFPPINIISAEDFLNVLDS
ncbi:MAG: putative toxin-antitoxin system toxin component, PIN family [Bacteroidota bacterium]|nr:putative toxin-antitoxin system toxin component, PIN family [Bacteroidota bacterium]